MPWVQEGNLRGPQGPTGPTGPAGPVGPAGLNWRGAWNGSNSYDEDDVVSWGGSSYFATAARGAGTPPPTGTAGDPGSDDSAVNSGWALLAHQGAQGAQGPQGTQGPTGQTGPTGPTGSTGPAGPAGPEGPAGPAGSQGIQGPAGSTGSTGTRGSLWYSGSGAPGTISGSLPGDKYLDTSNGDVYTFS